MAQDNMLIYRIKIRMHVARNILCFKLMKEEIFNFKSLVICLYLTFIITKCIISASKRANSMIKRNKLLNPYLLLIISFLAIVLLGSFLLSMPFVFRDNPNNEWCHQGSYLDAFFTSLSAMSLTGLTTYPDGLVDTLSGAGQIIVMVLVQIGGLGIVTILTFLFSIFRRKLQFRDRLMISQAIAFNNFGEIVRFVRRLTIITVICELVGFGMGIPVFMQLFPNDWSHILSYSLFYSVSSFNNAGFDLFNSTNSLIGGLFTNNGGAILTNNWLYYYFTIYNGFLSLLGGVSFLVIIDAVIEHRNPRRWSSFTKMVLVMTVGLIVVMSFFLFLTDGLKADNPMNFFQVVMFIINCRTAGYSVYPVSEVSLPGKMICSLMMFIGGSPLSTAGGIKITTIFIIMISIVSYFRGKRIPAFKRNFSDTIVAKSMSLVFIVVTIIIVSFILVSLFGIREIEGHTMNPELKEDLQGIYLFSCFSFFGNVGFYTGIEPYLSVGSKIVLCFLMLLGHLGPMTFFQLFQNHLDKNSNVHYSFVEEDFLIG